MICQIKRIRMLRGHESYVFQVALFLLGDAELATATAQQALLEVFTEKPFFALSLPEREVRLKREVIRQGTIH